MLDVDRLDGVDWKPDPDESSGDEADVKPGQWLRYRLPLHDAGAMGFLAGALLLAASSAGVWFVYDWGLPAWFSAVLCIPGLPGAYVVFHGIRDWSISARHQPVLIEVSDHPLRASDSAQLLVVQPGTTPPKSISARLRCRRVHATRHTGGAGTQGGYSIDDEVMFEHPIELSGTLDATDDGTRIQGQLRIPQNAPCTGKSRDPNNTNTTTEFSWWIDVRVHPANHSPIDTSAPVRIVRGPFG